jgi:hypothetical protein
LDPNHANVGAKLPPAVLVVRLVGNDLRYVIEQDLMSVLPLIACQHLNSLHDSAFKSELSPKVAAFCEVAPFAAVRSNGRLVTKSLLIPKITQMNVRRALQAQLNAEEQKHPWHS